MAQLTGKLQEEIISDLQDAMNSELIRYITADEYLLGDVREKLKIAEIAAKSDHVLVVNAEP